MDGEDEMDDVYKEGREPGMDPCHQVASQLDLHLECDCYDPKRSRK